MRSGHVDGVYRDNSASVGPSRPLYSERDLYCNPTTYIKKDVVDEEVSSVIACFRKLQRGFNDGLCEFVLFLTFN